MRTVSDGVVLFSVGCACASMPLNNQYLSSGAYKSLPLIFFCLDFLVPDMTKSVLILWTSKFVHIILSILMYICTEAAETTLVLRFVFLN